MTRLRYKKVENFRKLMNLKYLCVSKYYIPDIKYIVCGSFVDIINVHKINYCRFFPGAFCS